MKNPVVASDGHTYERDWIDRHIKTSEDKRVVCPSLEICSPTTNNPLPDLVLTDNECVITFMKNEIAKMRQMNDAPKN
jgi:hypothetical protein